MQPEPISKITNEKKDKALQSHNLKCREERGASREMKIEFQLLKTP